MKGETSSSSKKEVLLHTTLHFDNVKETYWFKQGCVLSSNKNPLGLELEYKLFSHIHILRP